MSIFERTTIEKLLKSVLSLLLFLLPWQTILIVQEKFFNGVKWEYGTIGFYATEGLLWISVCLFIVWYWQHAKCQIQNSKFSLTKDRVFVLAVFIFLLYCFLGITWAIDKDIAFQQAFRFMEAALLFFMIFLGPLGRETGMKWFIAGATVQSILGIWQFLSQSTFSNTVLGLPLHDPIAAGTSVVVVGLERWLRAYGSFSHPNVFGGYLVVSLVCTGFLLWGRQRNFLRGKIKELRMKELLLLLSAMLQTCALFFTFSRSAWIAATIAFFFSCFFVFLRKKDFLLHIAVGITAIILVVLFRPLVTTRAVVDSPAEYVSISERVSGYQEAQQLFGQHPFVGVGAGNYTAASYAMHPNRPGWMFQPVHNVILLFLVEEGIVGLILISAIGVAFFKLGAKAQFLILVILAPLILFDHYLFSSYIGLLFFSLVFAWCPQSIPTSSTG